MFKEWSDIQLIALFEMLEAIDYESMPDIKNAGMYQAMDIIETELDNELEERGIADLL